MKRLSLVIVLCATACKHSPVVMHAHAETAAGDLSCRLDRVGRDSTLRVTVTAAEPTRVPLDDRCVLTGARDGFLEVLIGSPPSIQAHHYCESGPRFRTLLAGETAAWTVAMGRLRGPFHGLRCVVDADGSELSATGVETGPAG